jgi:aryl-alcohol dehydrogenase-like predicted oxidoreductase
MSLHPERRTPSVDAVGKALELGFRHFDNADLYPSPHLAGTSEALLGEALTEHRADRSEVFITSKCGIVFPQQRKGNRYKQYDSSPDYLRSSVEQSLKRLKTDYLDLFYIHRIDYLTAPLRSAETLHALRSEGKIRAVGLSNYDVHQARAFAAVCPVDAVQLEFNLLHQQPLTDGTHALATEWQIPLFAWAPLATGRLARVADEAPDWLAQRETGVQLHLKRIADDRGISLSQLALAWLQHLPGPVVPIVGSLNPSHLADAIGASNVQLEHDLWYHLMTIGRGLPIPHSRKPIILE